MSNVSGEQSEPTAVETEITPNDETGTDVTIPLEGDEVLLNPRRWIDGDGNIYTESPTISGHCALPPTHRRFQNNIVLDEETFKQQMDLFREATGREPNFMLIPAVALEIRKCFLQSSSLVPLEYGATDGDVGAFRKIYFRYYLNTDSPPMGWVGGYGMVVDTPYEPTVLQVNSRSAMVTSYTDGEAEGILVPEEILQNSHAEVGALDLGGYGAMSIEQVAQVVLEHRISDRFRGSDSVHEVLVDGACVGPRSCGIAVGASCDAGDGANHALCGDCKAEGSPNKSTCACKPRDEILWCLVAIPAATKKAFVRQGDFRVVPGVGATKEDVAVLERIQEDHFVTYQEIPLDPDAVWASKTKSGFKARFYEPSKIGMHQISEEVAESLMVETLSASSRFDRDAYIHCTKVAALIRRGLSVEDATASYGKTVEWYKGFQEPNDETGSE